MLKIPAALDISLLYDLYTRYPSVQTDTRKITEGSIFFALKGPNFNGNRFVAQALASGAAYAVTDEADAVSSERCILVPDVLQALQELALYHRRQLDIPFIAITGSNGKTTSKELVTAVLRQQYITYATAGNLNNHIGVPLTILSIRPDAQIAVVEMGANHLGEIASYCRIALPTHGIITNCGKAHLEGFGSIEGVRKGKGELYDHIRATGGMIFRNADLDYLEEMATGISRQISYGADPHAAYSGTALAEALLLDVAVHTDGYKTTLHTQLVGDYNFANVMLALAVGAHFDLPLQQIKAAIESYAPDNSRSQLLQKGSNRVILDAYNANPTSMRAAISNFAAAESPKLLWLGAMKEMGPEEEREHAGLVAWLQQWTWDQVILVGPEFQAFAGDYLWFPDAASAAEYLDTRRPEQANILIKGSRGSRMETLLAALD
jgi:UDP-N-acetylmuramoyl-tripeptide--D-alanyl-D-alanine ligase